MEGEINYSTIVFKNREQASGEKDENLTVYAEITHTGAAAASNDAAAARPHFPVSSVCLVILCVFLVMSISVIIYISVLTDKQRANLRDHEAEILQLSAEKSVLKKETERLISEKSDLKKDTERLISEKSVLKKETERLSRVVENANHTMEFILKFKTFPVNKFCSENKCQPCQQGWILFQEKCYLFWNKSSPWKTWEKSREFCQDLAADLVVVNSLEEQEFISQNIEYYYDKHHGYWLGLYESDKTWRWVDGHNDTLGYWMTLGAWGPCGLMIPGRNLTANWDPAKCDFRNKFICESEVFIRSD